jgi:hypothetical protein
MSLQRWLAASSVLVVGCGGGASTLPPAATAANVKRALIAQPCAELPGDPQAAHGRVFIQAAQVVSSDLQEPLDAWLGEHPVGIASVVSFMADKDVPTTVSWNRCLDEACAGSEPWHLVVTPELPPSASGPVRLTVQLSHEQGSQSSAQSATLETRSQKPVAIELVGAEAASWSLVVTPYLIGDDEDLRRLAACKSSAVGGGGAK